MQYRALRKMHLHHVDIPGIVIVGRVPAQTARALAADPDFLVADVVAIRKEARSGGVWAVGLRGVEDLEAYFGVSDGVDNPEDVEGGGGEVGKER